MAFTCPACGAEFDSQTRVDEHAQGEHSSGFRCGACGGEFDSQEKLDEHAQSAHAM